MHELPQELIGTIFTCITYGSDYKTISLVDRYWNRLIKKVHPNAHLKFCNHLLTLLSRYPNQQWSWNDLSLNPNITWEVVENHPNKPWDWYWLSKNPGMTWEIIKLNPNKPWKWNGVSQNPNITWEIVKLNPNKGWCWTGLSHHPNITSVAPPRRSSRFISINHGIGIRFREIPT